MYTYTYICIHKHTLYTGKGKITNTQETEKTNRIKDMT